MTATIDAVYQSDKELVSSLAPGRREAFAAWMAALDKAHQEAGSPYGEGPLASTTGVECWWSYFTGEYTPKDALDEDQSYD